MGTIQSYNAAVDLIERNLAKHPDKTAFIDDHGEYSFRELASRVNRFANVLSGLGIGQEARILLCLEDGFDFPVAALGAIKAGVIPVMVNTLLTPSDYDYLLEDSRAQALVVSAAVWPSFEPIISRHRYVKKVIMSGGVKADCLEMNAAILAASSEFEAAETRADEACLWQYSSGSTGRPKGTVHVHGAVGQLGEIYPRQILDLTEQDVTFSAAKLTFGYGFGNGILFPLATGATSVLMAERPTAEAVFKRLIDRRVTVFYGVPTLYQSMLSTHLAPAADALSLRVCVSAGEALPPDVAGEWQARFGTAIIDGIGSTEMLHIFMSNRRDDVAYGTTGRPLDGFEIRLLDEAGSPVAIGEVGELYVKGPTSASGYWNKREKTRQVFVGEWTRSGDKFLQDANGRYIYCGRSDDMLKVGGIYVSPVEVENSLISHPAVQDVAVVGCADPAGLIKPKAYIVLNHGYQPGSDTAETLKIHVKNSLAPYKYPRWFEFVDAIPRTTTGKVERYKLRSDSSQPS